MIQIVELICLLVFFVLDLSHVQHVDQWMERSKVSTPQHTSEHVEQCLYSESRRSARTLLLLTHARPPVTWSVMSTLISPAQMR
jgi:hypothetical protein